MEKSLLPGNITTSLFRRLLVQYDPLITSLSSAKEVKPGQKTLSELDHFRFADAVASFRSRTPKRQMDHRDVLTLVEWKLRHGKFRPTLMRLVSSNDGKFVQNTIRQAMVEYWANQDIAKAISGISKLKGIGPATASLLLSVHDPDRVIFFSDEVFWWLCCRGQTPPIKYNVKEYGQLIVAAQELADRLGVAATDIEKAAYVVMKEGLSQASKPEGTGQAASPEIMNTAADRLDIPKAPAKRKSSTAADMGSQTPAHPIHLSSRFAKIKRNLIARNEKAVADSFYRLLCQLRLESRRIKTHGSEIIPSIDYFDIHDQSKVTAFQQALQKRGIAVIKRVIPPNVASSWKEETQEYIHQNPRTKSVPSHDPQMYELYWSPGQVRARADSRLLDAQRFAMSAWRSSNPDAFVSSKYPVAYADRLRMRTPGDTTLYTGPHIDSGSVERWETDGYGHAGTYDSIFRGTWEEYDPWDSSTRLHVTSDLYNGAGSCSMFRMFQGWLSLSSISPGSGSILACPMLQLTTAYLLLRPFFHPCHESPSHPDFLHELNWTLNVSQTSILHGAVPGYIQELSDVLHPHLQLSQTMVPIPRVEPGDYVIWHPDTVHAVDPVHLGVDDASVLYIPACPLTQTNTLYLARQRRAFLLGSPAPDFDLGTGMSTRGESEHVGRFGVQEVADAGGEEGLRAMGLSPWILLALANGILFPDRFDGLVPRGVKKRS
ncbi:DUF1479-domain-containing protein [Xylariaceae sp. FL0016]|nr:DUF1479-domain-containing protein [Xylariaceae sp. FL0016]